MLKGEHDMKEDLEVKALVGFWIAITQESYKSAIVIFKEFDFIERIVQDLYTQAKKRWYLLQEEVESRSNCFFNYR